MTENIIISGFGGQGVLTAGLMLAESAVMDGLNATFFPSYGAEMRGGAAYCNVIISDKEIGSPVVTAADTLIAFTKPAVTKFLPKVKDTGRVIINSALQDSGIDFKKRKVIPVPIEKLALEKLGNSKAVNVIMLGAYCKAAKTLKQESLKKAIMDKFERKGEKIVNMNYQALTLGYDAVQGEL